VLGNQGQVALHGLQYRAEAERGDAGNDVSAIEPRKVENRIEQVLQGVGRGTNMRNQLRFALCGLRMRQRRNEKPKCMQRLPQVVAGGGEEVRLGERGAFRRLLLALQAGRRFGDAGTQILLAEADAGGHVVDAGGKRAQGAGCLHRHPCREVAGTDALDNLVRGQ
jgi:hypothetical protein